MRSSCTEEVWADKAPLPNNPGDELKRVAKQVYVETIPGVHYFTAAPRVHAMYISKRGIPTLYLHLTSALVLGANTPKEIVRIVV